MHCPTKSRAGGLTPSGDIDSDSHLPIVGAYSTACDEQGRLYVATPGILIAFERTSSNSFRQAQSGSLKLATATRFLFVGLDSIYIVGHNGDASTPIHLAAPDGSVTRSFGGVPTSQSSGSAPAYATGGALLQHVKTGRIVYVPFWPYEFRVYGREGTLISVHSRKDADFQLDRRHPETGRPLGNDVVLGAVSLPTGEIITEVLKRKPASVTTYKEERYFEIFDSDFNLHTTGVSAAKLGYLKGASGDGAVYFADISRPRGVTVVRARLTALPQP